MRLRTTIALAFGFLSLLQLAAVAPLALRKLDETLSAQLLERVDEATGAARAALTQTAADARRAMDELAGSDALERVARDLRQDPPPSHVAASASALMRPRGLSVLALFDERGRTLSSGHLPARLGDLDPELFSVTTRSLAEPVPSWVELRVAQGLTRMPALVTARALDYGDRRLWAVGGVLLDEQTAARLAKLTGARVEIWADGGLLAAAGEAHPPALERELSLAPATVRLSFSRAGQLATERRILEVFVAVFALGLAVAVLAGLVVARRITRPIEALTAAAVKLAGGALEARVEERASGEVGALVDAFNRMVADLKATTARLVASERIAAWQEVARRLAHEIKNPLTPIKMSLETLLAASQTDHPRFKSLFHESAGAVLEEVERLRKIVDEFSRFARLPKPALAPVNLGELASQVLALYASPPPGIQLSHSLEENVVVQADRDQLTQVLVNLIKNAEEAMPSGGQIDVRVRRQSQEALLEVADTGPGIQPEDRDRIFEPYFTSKEGGTGLGLAIAARICQEHGGRLEVGGAPGEGAVFIIALPSQPSAATPRTG